MRIEDDQQSWLVYSKDRVYGEDERAYSDYLKFKDVTELILELEILKYELKCLEREAGSFPRDNSKKARRKKERTFKNICAIEREIAKKMHDRILV